MPEETILLTNRQHALLMRVCKQESLTPSEFFHAAVKQRMEVKSPIAAAMIKAAPKSKGGAK